MVIFTLRPGSQKLFSNEVHRNNVHRAYNGERLKPSPRKQRSQYYNENAPEKRFREMRASCKISHMPRPTAPAPPPRRSHDVRGGGISQPFLL